MRRGPRLGTQEITFKKERAKGALKRSTQSAQKRGCLEIAVIKI